MLNFDPENSDQVLGIPTVQGSKWVVMNAMMIPVDGSPLVAALPFSHLELLTGNDGLLVGLHLLYAGGGEGEGHNFGGYFRPRNSLLVVQLCQLTTAPLPEQNFRAYF
jgi:hypothetical protein